MITQARHTEARVPGCLAIHADTWLTPLPALCSSWQLAKSGNDRDSKGFPIQQPPGGQRFTGGGFSLSTG